MIALGTSWCSRTCLLVADGGRVAWWHGFSHGTQRGKHGCNERWGHNLLAMLREHDVTSTVPHYSTFIYKFIWHCDMLKIAESLGWIYSTTKNKCHNWLPIGHQKIRPKNAGFLSKLVSQDTDFWGGGGMNFGWHIGFIYNILIQGFEPFFLIQGT